MPPYQSNNSSAYLELPLKKYCQKIDIRDKEQLWPMINFRQTMEQELCSPSSTPNNQSSSCSKVSTYRNAPRRYNYCMIGWKRNANKSPRPRDEPLPQPRIT